MDENKQELPAEVTVEPRVVEAVFTSSNTGQITQGGGKSPLAALIQKAMSDAVEQALKDGVSINDAEEIKRRMLDARARMKEWFAEQVAAAIAQAEKLAAEQEATKEK